MTLKITPLMVSLLLFQFLGQSPCFGITSEEYLAKARLFIRRKNHIAAEKMLKEAVKHYPNDETLWLNLTNIYRKRITPESLLPLAPGEKSSADKAKDCANQAIRINPNCAKAYAYLADIALYNDEYKKSIRLANQALKLDPKTYFAFKPRAYANIALGNPSKASKDLEIHIDKSESDFRSIRTKAQLEENAGNYNKAKKYYQLLYRYINKNKLLLIDRDYITLSIARCTEKEGYPEKSLKIVSDLIKKKPANYKAYIQRARLYKKLEKKALAKRDYTKALALKYSTEIMNERKLLGK